MENAHEYLCQEKSKRIDPMVKFLSNITEAEKKQVKKALPTLPLILTTHILTQRVKSANSAAMPLSPGTAPRIKERSARLRRAGLGMRLLKLGLVGKSLSLSSYNFLNFTNFCL